MEDTQRAQWVWDEVRAGLEAEVAGEAEGIGQRELDPGVGPGGLPGWD